jgi:membrane fusion protein, multidrug efflux system
VAAQGSKAESAERSINSAAAELALATSTLRRTEPLLARGYVTAGQIDEARTNQRAAEIALQQARLGAAEAREAISNIKPAEEAVQKCARRAHRMEFGVGHGFTPGSTRTIIKWMFMRDF